MFSETIKCVKVLLSVPSFKILIAAILLIYINSNLLCTFVESDIVCTFSVMYDLLWQFIILEGLWLHFNTATKVTLHTCVLHTCTYISRKYIYSVVRKALFVRKIQLYFYCFKIKRFSAWFICLSAGLDM